MVATTSAQMFVPQVHEDMAQAAFLGAVKVAGSAAVLEDNTLEGNPGDTVTFPKWGALTDLADLLETDVLVPEQMSTSSASATIKEAGKAVEVKDRAKLVALGDPLAEAARQFGILAARKVDADLITAAQASLPSAFNVAVAAGAGNTKLSWDRIVDSIVPFGDDWDPTQFAGFFINSAQMADLLRDPAFIQADRLGTNSEILSTGSLGVLAGVNVKVSDRVAAKTILGVKNRALGLLYKRRPIVESDRDILARSNVITTNLHYAVKRLNDRGVVKVTLPAT